MANLLLNSNALHIPLADKSIHCVVTSPPYYGLRDYGTTEWRGGDSTCNHNPQKPDGGARADRTLPLGRGGVYKDICGKCGAVRVDEQIGLEQSPEEYVAKIVEVFREVKRVLRDDGTVWLVLGDSYAGSGGAHANEVNPGISNSFKRNGVPHWGKLGQPGNYLAPKSLKPKDLIGIPWRVAFALQADRWYLRSDIIWAKPNPMPESVRDRPTKSHEYMFLFSKSSQYYYDAEAIREPNVNQIKSHNGYRDGKPKNIIGNMSERGVTRTTEGLNLKTPEEKYNPAGRNCRDVWTIATQSSGVAHFATFPMALIKPSILAGTSEGGCCRICHKPLEREVILEDKIQVRHNKTGEVPYWRGETDNVYQTVGWRKTCDCATQETTPSIVFDPFIGSGTTCIVAEQLGRNGIGMDLSSIYLRAAQKRLRDSELPMLTLLNEMAHE